MSGSFVSDFDDEQPETLIIEDVGVSSEDSYLGRELQKLDAAKDDPFAAIPYEALNKNDKRRATRLIKKYEGAGGAHSKYMSIEQINGYMLYRLASPPYNLDYLNYLATEDPTNHACIMTKAYNIVGVGYFWKETSKIQQARQMAQQADEMQKMKLEHEQGLAQLEYQTQQNNENRKFDANGNPAGQAIAPPAPPDPTDPENQPDQKMQKLANKLIRVQNSLNDLMDSLNEEDSLMDTLLKVWIDYEATGNGYIEIGRKNNGEIGYVGHIPAATMRVRIDRDGYVQWVLPGYVGPQPFGLAGPYPGLTFFRNFGDTTTPDVFGKDPKPNEVIHIKKHSSKSTYYGVPDIIPAIASVVGDKFAREYNLDYFENKAVPRYALIVKGAKLSAQAERKILDYFRKEVKGKHHGTLYIPVPASVGGNVDVTLQAIEDGMQEGSFHQYREDNKHEIAMAHRVPTSKLAASGSGGHQAQGREDSKNFKELIVNPEQTRLEWKVNKIVSTFTDMFTLKFNEYELDDEDTRSRIHDRYVRLGVENPNEIRAELNKFPRKGGDAYLDPTQQPGGDANLNITGANGQQSDSAPGAAGAPPTGRPRQTTDGSPKNSNSTRTPADKSSSGRASQGSKGGQSTHMRSNAR